MFLKKTKPDSIKEALWWEEHCIRRQGGYDLDTTSLPSTAKWMPKGAVLKFDATSGKCSVVKSAKVVEAVAKSATTVKVEKGSFFAVGDKIAGSAISAITNGDSYDTLTVAALSDALNIGDTVTDYDAENDVVIGFNYDTFPIDKDAAQQVTPTLQVMEVEEDSLPYPINDDIKKALNANGVALFKIQ